MSGKLVTAATFMRQVHIVLESCYSWCNWFSLWLPIRNISTIHVCPLAYAPIFFDWRIKLLKAISRLYSLLFKNYFSATTKFGLLPLLLCLS